MQNKEMNGYIYLITNKLDGKQYIGQCNNINRFDNYWGSGTILKNSIKKYGKNNFSKEKIEENIKSQKELDILEIKYINEYNTIRPNGYNLSSGGQYEKHTHNEETLNKMKGKQFTEEHKQKIGKSNKGKIISDEHKEKLRKYRTGKKHSDETKEKIKEKSIGRTHTEESKKKMCGYTKGKDWAKGKKFTEEHKQKISESNIGKKHTQETLNKMSKSLKGKKSWNEGKKHSDEIKEKIRKSLKKYYENKKRAD